MIKTIRQKVRLPATPAKVYAALINSREHTRFTGAPARIAAKAGGAFTCYDGYLTGFTLELVPGKRIVQAWRSQGWPAGLYSVVTFAFAPVAGGQTQLAFTHVGVPAGDYAAKSSGWKKHYWVPLKAYLES